jgi:hypothetical protein
MVAVTENALATQVQSQTKRRTKVDHPIRVHSAIFLQAVTLMASKARFYLPGPEAAEAGPKRGEGSKIANELSPYLPPALRTQVHTATIMQSTVNPPVQYLIPPLYYLWQSYDSTFFFMADFRLGIGS